MYDPYSHFPTQRECTNFALQEGVVTVVDDSRIQFENGDNVTFREVGGLQALNENEKGYEIKILGTYTLYFPLVLCLPVFMFLGPYTFSIGDVSSLGQYTTGGYATQVKKSKVLNFVWPLPHPSRLTLSSLDHPINYYAEISSRVACRPRRVFDKRFRQDGLSPTTPHWIPSPSRFQGEAWIFPWPPQR